MKPCDNCDKLYQVLDTKLARIYTERFCSEQCRKAFVAKLMKNAILPPASDAVH